MVLQRCTNCGARIRTRNNHPRTCESCRARIDQEAPEADFDYVRVYEALERLIRRGDDIRAQQIF